MDDTCVSSVGSVHHDKEHTMPDPAIIDLPAAAKYVDMLVAGEWGINVDIWNYDDDFPRNEGFCLFRMDDNIMVRSEDGLDCECSITSLAYLASLLIGFRREHVSLYLL